jgi:hypothetical protein
MLVRCAGTVASAPPTLLDQLRALLRRNHYAHRTEDAYGSWGVRFVRFHHLRQPRALRAAEGAAFLPHLVVGEHVPQQPRIRPVAPCCSSLGMSRRRPLTRCPMGPRPGCHGAYPPY